MFAKRLEIARRLIEGETYESIARDLKVTEHTIASISNILARDGYGFKIAHQKLQGLDQAHQKKREQRQDYLERKRWPKFREQILVEGLVKAGTAKVSSLLRKRTRQSTARKQLSV